MWYFFLLLRGTEKDYSYVLTFQSRDRNTTNLMPSGRTSQYTYRCGFPNVYKYYLAYIDVEYFNKCRCGTPEDCACQFLDVTAA